MVMKINTKDIKIIDKYMKIHKIPEGFGHHMRFIQFLNFYKEES